MIIVVLFTQKLQKKPVNDADELKKIAEKFWITIRSLLNLAKDQLGSLGVDSSEQYYGLPIPAIAKLQFLPQISSLKVSVLNYILHEPLPSLKDLFLTYHPRGFNPLYSYPPFPIEGSIVNGEYLFTFGGEQITLHGNCQYVIAKDIVDGNFTVVAKISDKQLQSIGIVDKSGESIELSSNGKITHNDKPAEFPLHEKTLHAFRKYYGSGLVSEYGVFIRCTVDLKVCHIWANGFYHSKLRGLLGKSGYEAFDALTLPNGKVSDSANEFVNAYKLQGTCSNAEVVEKPKQPSTLSAECENIFGYGSTLKYCSLILDQAKYLDACEHAVASASDKQKKEAAACEMGFAYTYHCRSQNIPVKVPTQCENAKCHVSDDSGAVQSYEVGERYKPASAKKADIVFVVDTAIESKSLSDLVQHFINELRHSLKKDYDTQIAVIGYKKGDKYSKHFTSDGKLDITKFHLTKKPENNPQEEKLLTVGCEYVDPILQKLYNASLRVQDELSLLADGRAFREALSYPFRSNAQKTIVAIRSDVLQHSNNPVSHRFFFFLF